MILRILRPSYLACGCCEAWQRSCRKAKRRWKNSPRKRSWGCSGDRFIIYWHMCVCVRVCIYIYIYINYSVYFIYILCIYIYMYHMFLSHMYIFHIYIYIICIYYIHTYVLYLWTIAYDVDTVCEDLTILVRYGDGIGRRILSCEVL